MPIKNEETDKGSELSGSRGFRPFGKIPIEDQIKAIQQQLEELGKIKAPLSLGREFQKGSSGELFKEKTLFLKRYRELLGRLGQEKQKDIIRNRLDFFQHDRHVLIQNFALFTEFQFLVNRLKKEERLKEFNAFLEDIKIIEKFLEWEGLPTDLPIPYGRSTLYLTKHRLIHLKYWQELPKDT